MPGAGRTSIIRRCVDRTFGAVSHSTSVEISNVVTMNGTAVQFVAPLSDTENFDDLPYIGRAAGVLLVYDITDEDSYYSLTSWWEVPFFLPFLSWFPFKLVFFPFS